MTTSKATKHEETTLPGDSTAAFAFVTELAKEVSSGKVELPSFPDVAVRVRKVLADEAVAQALEVRLLGLAQIEIAEQAPDPDREVAHERLLDPAEPPHEAGGQTPRNAVGEEEVQILLLRELGQQRSHRHAASHPLAKIGRS